MPGISAEVRGHTAPGFETVRAAFAANLASGQEAGAAVSVYWHGRQVVDLWGGMADPDAGRPWERDTLQVVYSTTKAITATCALLLAQRGELDLDAPVARYWPEFAAAGKERIPVRWLLTHQAGLPAVDRPISRDEAIAWDPVVPVLRRPHRRGRRAPHPQPCKSRRGDGGAGRGRRPDPAGARAHRHRVRASHA